MDTAELIDQLEVDGRLLADAAARVRMDDKVPKLDWDVRGLLTHVGGIHRWATDIVVNNADFDCPAGLAVGTGPADRELIGWFADGHAALVAALRAAPVDVECQTFLPASSPLAFWARRQAHETAIHRADAESVARVVPSFAADFAQDGISEILLGFAARPSRATTSASITLRAVDGPSWRIAIDPGRIAATEGDDSEAGLMVSGTSSSLYLWLWNRTSTVTLAGQSELAAIWAESVRVRWS